MSWSFGGPGVLALLLPSFSTLSTLATKLINFQSCTILLVAFLGNLQGLASRSPLRRPVIDSSSYSSITISSRGLLFIFMEFLSSCLVAEVFLQKNFQRRGPGGYLILHNCLWRSYLTFHIKWSLNSWIFRWQSQTSLLI